MKYVKITNKTERPTDELMPLLRLAYESAKEEYKRPCTSNSPFALILRPTRTGLWRCRKDYNTAIILLANPSKIDDTLATTIDGMAAIGMNEVIVGVAAWMFADGLGAGRIAKACARDAIREYRSRKVEIDTQIAAVKQAKVDAVGEEFASNVFKDMEESTLEFKLAKLARTEKVWQNKFNRAESKLKRIRRTRSALIAADKRRTKREAALALATKGPQ